MLALAETRTLQGCYDCLLEAKDAYTRLATGARASAHAHPSFRDRAPDRAAGKGAGDRRRAVYFQSPGTRGRSCRPRSRPIAILKVVEAVPPDGTGLPVAKVGVFRRATVQYVAGLDAEIVWLLSDSGSQATPPANDRLQLPCVNTWRCRLTARTSGARDRRLSSPPLVWRDCRRSRGRSSWIRYRATRRPLFDIASVSATSSRRRRSKPYVARSPATPKPRTFSRAWMWRMRIRRARPRPERFWQRRTAGFRNRRL